MIPCDRRWVLGPRRRRGETDWTTLLYFVWRARDDSRNRQTLGTQQKDLVPWLEAPFLKHLMLLHINNCIHRGAEGQGELAKLQDWVVSLARLAGDDFEQDMPDWLPDLRAMHNR